MKAYVGSGGKAHQFETSRLYISG